MVLEILKELSFCIKQILCCLRLSSDCVFVKFGIREKMEKYFYATALTESEGRAVARVHLVAVAVLGNSPLLFKYSLVKQQCVRKGKKKERVKYPWGSK